jgi:hypothetical protein
VLGSAAQYQGITVGNGWWVSVTMPNVTDGGTYSLTPDTAPKIGINVNRSGYDASGNPTTVTDFIFATQTIKNSFPNDATIQDSQSGANVNTNFSLSEYVYQGETFGAGTVLTGAYTGLTAGTLTLTNNSTLAYPGVIADWVLPPKREWVNDLTLEVVAKHKFGRNGRPVACVRITGFDGTNTVSKICTYGLSTYGDNLEVYRATFNVSEFIAGNDVTFNFEAMPWVGDAAAVRSTTGGTFPSVTTLCPQVYRCGEIPDLRYAYVLTTGNDTTGTVQTSRAGAKATPFLTIAAAQAALFVAKNDLSGCKLFVGAGTFNWPPANIAGTTRTALHAWFTIEGDPDDVAPKTNCIVQTVGTTYVQFFNNPVPTMSWLSLSKLTLNIRVGMQGLLNANNTRTTLLIDDANLNVDLTATTTWCSAAVNYFMSVNAQSSNQTARVMQVNAANLRPHLIRNCTTNRGMQANVIATSTQTASTGNVALGDAVNMRPSNLIMANSKLIDYAGSAAGLSMPLISGEHLDIAISQCIFTGNTSNTQPLIAFGEKNTNGATNILFEYVTTAGGLNQTCMRLNVHNDPISGQFPTTTLSDQAKYKDFSLKNSLFQWVAVKDDRFSGAVEGNAGANLLIQGWDKRYGVGFYDTCSAYTPDEWIPEYFGVGSLRTQARTFAAGTFRPTSGFATCAIQSLSFDIDGVARRQDGTGASGALES